MTGGCGHTLLPMEMTLCHTHPMSPLDTGSLGLAAWVSHALSGKLVFNFVYPEQPPEKDPWIIKRPLLIVIPLCPAPIRADSPGISFLSPRDPSGHWPYRKWTSDILKDFLHAPPREGLGATSSARPRSLPHWINVFKVGWVCKPSACSITHFLFRCAATVYLHKVNRKIVFEMHIKFIFVLLQFYFCQVIIHFSGRKQKSEHIGRYKSSLFQFLLMVSRRCYSGLTHFSHVICLINIGELNMKSLVLTPYSGEPFQFTKFFHFLRPRRIEAVHPLSLAVLGCPVGARDLILVKNVTLGLYFQSWEWQRPASTHFY